MYTNKLTITYIRSRHRGLTNVYNLFQTPTCTDADIAKLRRVPFAIDTAITATYDQQNLALNHNLYGDAKDCRYTRPPAAKSAVLRRRIRLNYRSHTAEVAVGLHKTGNPKPGLTRPSSAAREPDPLSVPRRNRFDDQLTRGKQG